MDAEYQKRLAEKLKGTPGAKRAQEYVNRNPMPTNPPILQRGPGGMIPPAPMLTPEEQLMLIEEARRTGRVF